MKKIDFDSDIKHLISYYNHLLSAQDKAGEEMEEITKDIIRKKDEENDIELEDFIDLEEKSFMTNLYQQEMLKVSSSIKAVYRLSINAGYDLNVDDDSKKVLDRIVNDGESDFIMYVDNNTGSVVFKDESVEEGIKNMCKYRVDPSSLEDRFNMLKSQYEDFLKIINNESKKSD